MRWTEFFIIIVLLALGALMVVRIHRTPTWPVEIVSAPERAVSPEVTCTRCGKLHPRDAMTVYTDPGRAEILLCPRCVYDQAQSFLKFCPVEETE